MSKNLVQATIQGRPLSSEVDRSNKAELSSSTISYLAHRGRGRRLGSGGGCYGARAFAARLFLLASARRLGRRIRLILVG